MSAGFQNKSRLETWKEVAAFFRKDERTVKRWEAERGLPIHRLPGESRSRIFAVVSELEAWRDGSANRPAAIPLSAPPESSSQPEPYFAESAVPSVSRANSALLPLALVGFVALACLALFVSQRQIATPPPLAAQRDYILASEDWARRTPESLNRAAGEYQAAIVLDPNYAEAYAGLANTYNLLREYTHMSPSQAYPLARDAAQRALQLNPDLASAHCALAFAEFWGFWNPVVAQHEFERAIALDPHLETAQHWYATFLSAMGDERAALVHIDAALALNPRSQATASDRDLILYLNGRDAEARLALRNMERSNPRMVSVHAYLSDIYFDQGEYGAYLDEVRTAATLTDDQATLGAVSAAEPALIDGGRERFLVALINTDLRRFRNGEVSAYTVATVYAARHDIPNALAYLRLSLERHETDLMAVRANRAFAILRSTPEFATILNDAKPLDNI